MSPGRRANWEPSGFHFVAVKDSIYLANRETCVCIDAASGKQLAEFQLPSEDDQWGRIKVWKDQLIVSVFRTLEEDGQQPIGLLAMDRHTGRVLWAKESLQAFPLVAIGGDRIFCCEGILDGL